MWYARLVYAYARVLSHLQPLTLDEMCLSEGGGVRSLSLASFEPEFIRPVPPMLPIADSEVSARRDVTRHQGVFVMSSRSVCDVITECV